MTHRPRFDRRQQGTIRRIAVDRLAEETVGIVPMSERPNRIYGHNDFVLGLANAAHRNKSIGKATTTRRSGFTDLHGSPTDEWFNQAIKKAKMEDIDGVLERSMRANLARIRQIAPEVEREWKKSGMVVGIDLHEQARYDKKPKEAMTDEEEEQWMDGLGLCRSRYERGTALRTTYATVSCITKKASFFLGTIHKGREDKKSDIVRKLVRMCDDLGIRLGLVMLDRGFYTTDVLHALGEIRREKTGQDPESSFNYLVQCVRTDFVKGALDEHASGKREAVSEGVITGKTSDSGEKLVPVSYCLQIADSKAHEARERRKARKAAKGQKKRRRACRCSSCGQKKPEAQPDPDQKGARGYMFTGFASGGSDVDVSKYAERWMNETGYRVLEEQMPRTRSTAPAARHLCIVISIILYNLTIIANLELLALSKDSTRAGWHTHDTILFQFLRALKGLLPKWRREPDPILDTNAPPSCR